MALKQEEPQAAVPRRTDWIPQAFGAECGDCPLRHAEGPVRGTARAHAVVGLILGEAPGRKEAERGFPLAGPAGVELEAALAFAGSSRKEWALDTVLACRPPMDRLEAAERALNAENRKRKALNRHRRKLDRHAPQLPLVPHPRECCAPRVDRLLARHLSVLVLGTAALHTAAPHIAEKRMGILAVRGTPITYTRADGREVRVMGTLSPEMVRIEPRWRRTFKRDIRRAKRFFQGKSSWQEPVITYQPTVEQLEAFLWDERVSIHSADIETDGIRPMEAALRCIGFAAPGVPGVAGGMPRAMVVPFLSIDGQTEFYSARDRERLKALIIRWHGDKTRAKVGHNYRYYDALVLFARWGEFPIRNCFDSLCGHSVADSELPHALGFVGVDYDTDVPAWKASHTATTSRDDKELWRYCACDCVVNVRIAEPLAQDIIDRGQKRALQALQDNQDAAREMHVNGMLIDPVAVRAHQERLQAEVIDYGARFMALLREQGLEEAVAAGRKLAQEDASGRVRRGGGGGGSYSLDASDPDDDPLGEAFAEDLQELVTDEELARIGGKKGLSLDTFNPTSATQVRHLFFTHLGVPMPAQLDKKEAYTSTGEPSTNDAVLRAIVCDKGLPEWIRTLADMLRRYRGALKPLGFPLGRLFHDPADRDKGALYADGRIHADWKVHVAVTSRMATSPNCQNWPIYLRDIVIAQVGALLLGADYDQIELRLAAARWGFKRYLEALALGQDPHQLTMELCFGEVMWSWEGAPPQRYFKKGIGKDSYFSRMRDLAKRLFYASLYGADSTTIHRVLTSAEQDDGALLFPDLTLKQVALLHRNLLTNLPELTAGWAAEEAFFEANGYVEEPVTGRRRYVATGKKNEVVNFAIQASAAGLINLALKRIRKRLLLLRADDAALARRPGRPRGYAPGNIGPGLLNQMHDALYFEIRADLAAQVCAIVTEEMTCTHPAFPGVLFAAECHAAELDASGYSRMIAA